MCANFCCANLFVSSSGLFSCRWARLQISNFKLCRLTVSVGLHFARSPFSSRWWLVRPPDHSRKPYILLVSFLFFYFSTLHLRTRWAAPPKVHQMLGPRLNFINSLRHIWPIPLLNFTGSKCPRFWRHFNPVTFVASYLELQRFI